MDVAGQQDTEEEQTAAAKIAVLSVHKKGSILKNIFLNCPPRPYSDQGAHEEGRGPLRWRGVADEVEEEEVRVLIGRHPDCHIALDHPSISRFHLELRLSPGEQKLSVVDRSSVHGTWVSGTKIPPNVPVNLVDGDSLRLGALTRVYRLQWVSASRAFEMENPLAPLPEEETYQDDSSYVTSKTTEQQDSEIPLAPLPEKKDHAGQEELDDVNAHWISEMPSAPSMTEFMSPASMKAVEESSISSLVAPMLECFGSLFPLVGENHTSLFASSAMEEQSHKDRLSPLNSSNSMPSSLLSRSKSKSISCLRIRTGRNWEGDENTTVGIVTEGTVKENSTVSEQAEILEMMYAVPIGDFDAQEAFKEFSDANMENVAPISPHQTTEETSLTRAWSMKEVSSGKNLKQKSISVSCPGIQTRKHEERFGNMAVDNGDEESIGKENGRVCEQVKAHESLCRALLDDLSREVEDKDLFSSDKENLTPRLSCQIMKKNNTLKKKSLRSTLSAEEDLSGTLRQNSRIGSCLRTQSGMIKERIVNSTTDTKVRKTTRKENNSSEQVSGEVLCRVLFDGLIGQEEDKEVFDSDKENATPMSACKHIKNGSTVLQESLAANFSKVEDLSSTLDEKSTSVSSLKTQSGRRKERIENTTANCGVKDGTRNENFSFCEQVESEEMLCEVIFNSLGGQGDKLILDSDKENVTPVSAQQNKKSSTFWQNSFAGTLSVEEELCISRHMNSRELSSKGEGSSSSVRENSALHSGQKSKKTISTLQKSFNLNSGEGMTDSDKATWTPVKLRNINSKETICENSAKSCIGEGFLASGMENKTPGSRLKLNNAHEELLQSINVPNVSKQLCHLDNDTFTPNSADVKEGIMLSEHKVKFEENGCFPDKENQTPGISWSMKKKELSSDVKIGTPFTQIKVEDKEDTCFSDKQNHACQISGSVKPKPALSDVKIGKLSSEKNMKVEDYENGCSPDKENQTPEISRSAKIKELSSDVKIRTPLSQVKVEDKEDTCFTDKQNRTCQISMSVKPKQALSDVKIGILSSEHNVKVEDTENGCSSEKENQTPQVSNYAKTQEPLSETYARIQREIMKKRVDRIPFQPLLESSPSRTQSILCSNSTSYNIAQKYETDNDSNQTTTEWPQITAPEKKKWNIVVDTECLLDEESRKSLQLLQGIKGTHVIIPRIVVRELDSLKRHESFFRKSTRASSVLQWIEDCMQNVSWWIHVQSSFEDVPVLPTPPASPQASCSNGTDDVVVESLSFSTYGSFAEIVSPTAEDHILECALLFRKLRNDGQLVLLSNSTTLKIKAMAEGLLCETAKEFRESLVNPFSKRFLWADSSPRGPTWSCSSEVGLFDNYYCQRPAVRRSVKAPEPARGLKLILFHNSQYRQFSSIK